VLPAKEKMAANSPYSSVCYLEEVLDSSSLGTLDSTETMAPTDKKASAGSADELTAVFGRQLSMASRSVHADDHANDHAAVAPPMHVSTTFRYNDNPDKLVPWSDIDVRMLPTT
jgi:hypothetical protein